MSKRFLATSALTVSLSIMPWHVLISQESQHDISTKQLGLDVPVVRFNLDVSDIELPITDHPLLIQNTYFGAVATLNILNPGSWMFPELQQAAHTPSLPEDGETQMTAMADYIDKIFKSGVRLLVVQEVPAPGSIGFTMLVDSLEKKLDLMQIIDFSAFKAQWLVTKGQSFGTSILINSYYFKLATDDKHRLLPPKACLSGRGAVYELVAIPSNVHFLVANIHGDYNHPEETANFINQFHGLCLGDSNIRVDDKAHRIDIDIGFVSTKEPSVVLDKHVYRAYTLDVLKDACSQEQDDKFIPDRTAIAPLQDD